MGGIRLGRMFGIPVNAGVSWLFIVILIATALQQTFVQGGAAPTPAAIAGMGGALLFFASVLAHELSHSVVAVRRGIPVRQIRLFIFGGVSELEHEATRPADEFSITIAGPLSSLVLAGVFWGGAQWMSGLLAAVLGWLAAVNLMLALFNLLPGFPLDGGRVLRAALWRRSGDRARATRTAARVGQAIAGLMVAGGLLASTQVGFDGIWLAMIGWFLYTAAGVADRESVLDPRLRGVPVRKVMRPIVGYVSPALPLGDVRTPLSEVTPVASPWGEPVGVLLRTDAESVPVEDRPWRRVGDVMRRLRPGELVDASMMVDAMLAGLAGSRPFHVVVTEGGEPVGVVTSDILDAAVAAQAAR